MRYEIIKPNNTDTIFGRVWWFQKETDAIQAAERVGRIVNGSSFDRGLTTYFPAGAVTIVVVMFPDDPSGSGIADQIEDVVLTCEGRAVQHAETITALFEYAAEGYLQFRDKMGEA